MLVTAEEVIRDDGTIVVFAGTFISDKGAVHRCFFGADHRPAQDIISAIAAGETPECEVPVRALL